MMNAGATEVSRFLVGLTVAAFAYSCLFASWLVLIRQPAWRRVVGRSCLTGILILPLLCWIAPLGRLNWIAGLGRICDNLNFPRLESVQGIAIETSLILVQYVAIVISILWATLGWLASRWVSSTSFVPDREILELFESLRNNPSHAPRLKVSARISRPVLIGFFHPTIYLPATLIVSGDQERLRLAILHELAHIKAGDFGFHLIATFARVLGVLIPPVWFIQDQLRLDHEFLADRQATEGYGTSRSYARTLLNWAVGLPTRMSRIGSKAMTGSYGRGSALSQRIAMLVGCPFSVATKAPRWWTGLVLVVTTIGLLSSSMLALDATKPAGGIFIAPAARPPTPTQTYFARNLMLIGSRAGPDGRVRPIYLPIPLAETFDVSITVEADLATIGRMRLAGYPIPSLPGHVGEDVPPSPLSTHHVRVLRTATDVTIWADDVELTNHAVVPSLPTRLSIEAAPDSQILIHDLTVSW